MVRQTDGRMDGGTALVFIELEKELILNNIVRPDKLGVADRDRQKHGQRDPTAIPLGQTG